MIRWLKKLILLANVVSLILLVSHGATHAALLDLPESPLFVTGFVDPNIMFLVDNSGSMSNIVPDAPYAPNSADISCPAAIALDNSTQIELRVTAAGSPYFNVGTDYDWGADDSAGATGLTSRPVRCFAPDTDYLARLYGNDGADGNTKSTSGYLGAQYTGHYLNWYFGSKPSADCSSYSLGSQSSGRGTNARRHPCNERRIDIARNATSNLVNSLNNIRVGLASYNSSTGATINVGIDAIDTNRSNLLTAISGLTPSGSTPLAESLHEIGRYFVGQSGTSNTGGPNGQYNGNLVLHPGKANERTLDDDAVFNRSPNYATGISSESPIQAFCQQNFAVLLTDGRPQSDQDITLSTGLQDYDSDCDSSHANYNDAGCGSYDKKTDQIYETKGSDYLDDVANALYEIDLRPDMDDFDGSEVVNNIITYTIGFADDQVINDPLMQETANNGGGLFLQATNADALAQAFATATADIFSHIGSAAAVGATSGSVRSGTRIYQGRFNSGNWSGQLLSIPVNPDGSLSPPEWDAALKLTNSFVSNSRKILTYSGVSGIPFRYASLNVTQQAAMDTDADGNLDPVGSEKGENRTNYIRGLRTDEAPNGEGYRPRTTLLGDIMNSEPIFVGSPPFDYPDELESASYSTFKQSLADRPPVVYVGANDGMLHGFEAKPSTASGTELIAYIPNKLIPKLSKLTDPNYTHQTYVDASPMAGDIIKSGSWATILAGALGRGGQGLYALDITDPSLFSESKLDSVMWEFTDADDADLGYVYGKPAIVRITNNDRWVVATGNGYNNSEADSHPSSTGQAALFLIYAQGGGYLKIETLEGSTANPNALASPAPVDIDGDHIVDIIYAGDLYGNLWKFDITDKNTSKWTKTKLFTAVDGNGNAQPITTQVEVSRHHSEPGFMVYFGTGKYLEPDDTDPTGANTQTFYGIWDDLSDTPVNRVELYEQNILAEITNPSDSNEALRITSDKNSINWTTHMGWRMDLLNTESGNTNNFGERVITNPVYLTPRKKFPTGRILFTTLIPNSETCGFGGSGWLMELDPNDGSRLSSPPFDINRSGIADESDIVSWNGDSETVVSGKRTKFGPGSGIPTQPKVLEGEQGEYKYNSDTTGAVSVTKEPAPISGRTSWRELTQ